MLAVLDRAKAFSAAVSGDGVFASRLFKIVLLVQFGLAALALGARLGLYADGAYFNYIIASGEPWASFWNEMSSRSTVYLLEVLPIAELLKRGVIAPSQLVYVQSFAFFAAPLVQYLIVFWLGKQRPHLLLFPAANYIFLSLLCFGFETEMTFVPGFFWIAFFAGVRFGWSHPLTIVAQILMVFCHELAAVSAVAIVAAAVAMSRGSGKSPPWVLIATTAACLALLLMGKTLGYSPQGNQNAASVLNPFKIFENPAFLLTMAAVAVFFVLHHLLGSARAAYLVTMLFFMVLCYSLWASGLSFGSGRYSARSLLAVGTPALGLLCLLAALPAAGAPVRLEPGKAERVEATMMIGLFAMTVLTLIFIGHWWRFLDRIETFARPGADGADTAVVALAEMRGLDPNLEKRIAAVGYTWTLPFLSTMASRQLSPEKVIFDPDQGLWVCRRGAFRESSDSFVPPKVRAALRGFCGVSTTAAPRRAAPALRPAAG